MRYKFIAVEGNIGAGKTTLAEILANEWDALLLKEQFGKNPYLERFYEDPDTWAMQTELFFLMERVEQLRQLPTDKLIVSDYTIYKSLWFSSLNLRPTDQQQFAAQYHQHLDSLPQPDLILYIHRDITQLQDNIKQRGRDFEQDKISDSYLQKLEEIYHRQLEQLTGMPRIVIDGRQRDFTTAADLDWLKGALDKPLENKLYRV